MVSPTVLEEEEGDEDDHNDGGGGDDDDGGDVAKKGGGIAVGHTRPTGQSGAAPLNWGEVYCTALPAAYF